MTDFLACFKMQMVQKPKKNHALTAVGKGVTATKYWQTTPLFQPGTRPRIRSFPNWVRGGANKNLNQPKDLMIKSWKAEGQVSQLVLTSTVMDLNNM